MPSSQTAPVIEQVELKPSQLVPHKNNIRADVGDVTDLAKSVKAKGVLQPLVVVPNGKPDRYVIIAGHRRHAAAKAAKVSTVPCVIRHDLTDEADQIAVMMVENGQRTDLTAVEEAKGVQTLLDLGDTQKKISERTGMSATKVRQRAKVAKLPDELSAKLTKHAVTLDDAVFVADHTDNADDLALLEDALGTNNWAVTRQKVIDRVASRKREEKLLADMVEKHGRLGRKNKKGFYDYPEAGPKRLWPGLADLVSNHIHPEKVDMDELKHRLLVTQALEAAKTYEEGVVTDPREADVGSIIGFGFAPYSGGTLSYIDNMGAAAFVKLCESLAKKHGERFKPNRLLKRMAKTGDTFYGSAEKKAAA